MAEESGVERKLGYFEAKERSSREVMEKEELHRGQNDDVDFVSDDHLYVGDDNEDVSRSDIVNTFPTTNPPATASFASEAVAENDAMMMMMMNNDLYYDDNSNFHYTYDSGGRSTPVPSEQHFIPPTTPPTTQRYSRGTRAQPPPRSVLKTHGE